MTIIGLTGGSGTGKSTALRVLADMGACVIDCDMVYHELLESNGAMLDEIARRFPGVVSDGRLMRKALGEIVFHDPVALADLNALTHGYVRRAVDMRISDLAERGILFLAIEGIAIIEAGIAGECDVVVAFLAPEEIRVQRIMTREGIGRDYALARVRSQKPDAFYMERAAYTLTSNFSSSDECIAACRELFARIVAMQK